MTDNSSFYKIFIWRYFISIIVCPTFVFICLRIMNYLLLVI